MQASFLLMQQFENQLSSGDNIDGNKISNGDDGDKEFDEKIENLLLYVEIFLHSYFFVVLTSGNLTI